MSAAAMRNCALRRERAESSRLAWAFAISVAAHLLLFGFYHAGRQFNQWLEAHSPSWRRAVQTLAEVLKKNEVKPVLPPQQQEVPLMYVDVSSLQASPEPPKQTPYYSDKNSLAANREAEQETGVPKITGQQTDIPKTEDVPREKPPLTPPARPVEPSPPPTAVEPAPEPRPAPQTKEKPPGDFERAKAEPKKPGELASNKTATIPRPETPARTNASIAPKLRPRTLAEALARNTERRPPGERMKQEGGVRRRGDIESLDARATPFGAYDAALIDAVRDRWYALLDERRYASDNPGRVVLHFSLHYDGRISDMKVASSTVSEVLELLCEKAVLDPAPYATWPSDMRYANGSDVRTFQFMFIYH